MYVFKSKGGFIKRVDMDNFDNDPDVFEWQYMNHGNDNDNKDFMFDPARNHRLDILAHDFLC